MRRNRLSDTLEPLLLSCGTTHAKDSPAAHRSSSTPTSHTPLCSEHTMPASHQQRVLPEQPNHSTQWLLRPSLLGERKGSQPPADGPYMEERVRCLPQPPPETAPPFHSFLDGYLVLAYRDGSTVHTSQLTAIGIYSLQPTEGWLP